MMWDDAGHALHAMIWASLKHQRLWHRSSAGASALAIYQPTSIASTIATQQGTQHSRAPTLVAQQPVACQVQLSEAAVLLKAARQVGSGLRAQPVGAQLQAGQALVVPEGQQCRLHVSVGVGGGGG